MAITPARVQRIMFTTENAQRERLNQSLQLRAPRTMINFGPVLSFRIPAAQVGVESPRTRPSFVNLKGIPGRTIPGRLSLAQYNATMLRLATVKDPRLTYEESVRSLKPPPIVPPGGVMAQPAPLPGAQGKEELSGKRTLTTSDLLIGGGILAALLL